MCEKDVIIQVTSDTPYNVLCPEGSPSDKLKWKRKFTLPRVPSIDIKLYFVEVFLTLP